jgi:ZIP family zinc transporter
MKGVWIALGLTFFAGMATGIGSAIAFIAKRTNYRFLSVATGFSAGVMLYVSFVEILFKGAESLSIEFGEYWGQWINALSFFGGILLIALIDHLIPAAENPHEIYSEDEIRQLHSPFTHLHDQNESIVQSSRSNVKGSHIHLLQDQKLMRMGLFTALAVGIHNFPEGLATFLAALQDTSIGVAIAFAIALHNIPEGISVSVPIFYATGNRTKAFYFSLLSGLAEPVGAGIAYLAIRFISGSNQGVISPHLMGILFGGVAGIMVYISLDELLPTSRAFGKGHDSILGLMGGMLIMALSLLLMK